MVAVPPAQAVQRDQQQFDPARSASAAAAPGLPVPPRTAARRSGPRGCRSGSGTSATRGDPGQVFRFQVLAHGPVASGLGSQRAACPDGQRDTARLAISRWYNSASSSSLGATSAARNSRPLPPGSSESQPGRSGGSGPQPAAAPPVWRPAARRAPAATPWVRDRPAPRLPPALRVTQQVHVIEDQYGALIDASAEPSRGTARTGAKPVGEASALSNRPPTGSIASSAFAT